MRIDRKRLDDVLAAASAITSHLQRGTLADGLVFDTDHTIVGATVEHDLPPLVDAARRLHQMVEPKK
ncbi:MAG: hypothetical protein ACRD2C_07395 [Acidimicrobiales bacterium]